MFIDIESWSTFVKLVGNSALKKTILSRMWRNVSFPWGVFFWLFSLFLCLNSSDFYVYTRLSLMTQFTNMDIEKNLQDIFTSNKMLVIHKWETLNDQGNTIINIALLNTYWRLAMTSYLSSILLVKITLIIGHVTQWWQRNLKLFLHLSND